MRSTVALLSLLLFAASAVAEEVTLWIGTTTPSSSQSKGIYCATLDTERGKLSQPELAAEISSPGFVVRHPNGKLLYSVCDLPDGKGPGVAVYKISDNGKSLGRMVNTQPIGDGGACHLTVDASGKCLFTAQYGGGSVAVFPLADDGSIKPRSALIEHKGSGPNKARQKTPHPHWVGVDPTNRFLLVPDLGMDRVMIYRMDLDKGRLERHGSGVCPPGAGPRHMKFSPNGKFVYVLNELDISVTVFKYDAKVGTLKAIQTITA
ncbi:MAG: lactonase family protein, partial [Pirellulales bacterium]|nr:lactonase family protein [Pirellulales bacterium]